MQKKFIFILILSFLVFAASGHGDNVRITITSHEGWVLPLLGVNTGPVFLQKNGDLFDATNSYKNAGVKQIRIHDFYGFLDMATLYPDQDADPSNPSSYDFKKSDEVFMSIIKGGFEPYLRIGDSWHSAPGFPEPKRRAPINRKNWVLAAVEVVRHYKKIAGENLKYVEIWNEPDHRQFWDAPQYQFNVLFDETVKAIKKEFPDLKVGGPGFSAAVVLIPKGKMIVTSFLNYLKEHNTPVDFISWHLYSNDPAVFAEIARFYRKELDRHGFYKTESHLTEYNTDTKMIPAGLSTVDLRLGSPAAAILTGAWIAMQNEKVDAAFFYRGLDPSMEEPLFYGLFRADGTMKKSAVCFSFWAQMAGCRKLKINLDEKKQSLWAIAGEDSSGNILLLISNPTGKDIEYTVNLENSGISSLIIKEINNTADKAIIRTVSGQQAYIPEFAVQMVKINRKLNF